MTGFELSARVNADKVFLVNYAELQGRFDPTFHSEMPDIATFSKLSNIAYVKGGKRIPLGKFYERIETPYLYLRVTDINQDGIVDYDGLKFIDEDVFEELSRYEIHQNQIVISIAGTIGRISLIKDMPNGKKVILTENCAKIILKTREIDPNYFSIVMSLPVVQKQIQLNYIQTTIPKLGLDRINNLYLPKFPTLATQQKVVLLYQNQYNQKQQKEQQAQALLDSIDGYLLNALGITLPEQDNRLEKRIFTVPFSEVTGGRIDPDIYFTKLYKIEGGTFANVPLHKLTHVNKGQSITSNHIVAGNYPVIAGGQSSPYSHNVCNYGGNIITVSASGAYAGFIWYHDYPIFASDCSVIQSKDEKVLNTLYLAELLKTKQKEIYNLQQGAGQPHVYSRDLMKLQIAVPPLEKQTEIATHISQIRAQTKQLQLEASEVLAAAKAEIERMILGESA